MVLIVETEIRVEEEFSESHLQQDNITELQNAGIVGIKTEPFDGDSTTSGLEVCQLNDADIVRITTELIDGDSTTDEDGLEVCQLNGADVIRIMTEPFNGVLTTDEDGLEVCQLNEADVVRVKTEPIDGDSSTDEDEFEVCQLNEALVVRIRTEPIDGGSTADEGGLEICQMKEGFGVAGMSETEHRTLGPDEDAEWLETDRGGTLNSSISKEKERELKMNSLSSNEPVKHVGKKLSQCGCSVNANSEHTKPTVVTLNQCPIHEKASCQSNHKYTLPKTNVQIQIQRAFRNSVISYFRKQTSTDSVEKLSQSDIWSKTLQHEMAHTGLTPQQCAFSEKAFNNRKKLKIVPSAPKPFQCHICEKAFTTRGNLKQHNMVHSGQKPYQCYICEKAFSQSSHLKRHRMIHTGHKPYQCEICKKDFTRLATLNRHKMIHN